MKSPSTLRTRLVQMDVRPGHPWANCSRMLEFIATARAESIDLIAFPEMAVPGYLIGDVWERDAFLRECEECHDALRRASEGIIVTFGSVALDRTRRNEDGRVRKYNALFVAENGRFLTPEGSPYPFVIKTLLPNYREFDDSRHFFDLRKLALEEKCAAEDLMGPVQTSKARIACLLCEDAWDMDYSLSPLSALQRGKPDLYVNASASPFTHSKNSKRHRVFAAHAAKLRRPMLYINKVGIQNNGKTVFTFDGSSCIYDGAGGIVASPHPFQETCLTCDIPLAPGVAFGHPLHPKDDGIAMLCKAICYGTRRFMELCGVERVVVGVSGGIDSAVVAAIYRLLLPPENLLLVNMPSRHNSPTTRELARRLARNLKTCFVELPIDESVAMTHCQVDGVTLENLDGGLEQRLRLTDAALENVQARDRSSRLLAAVAAAFGGVFTCNANKSEAAVGYTTLYGDLSGYLANIADLWKGDVYALARHLNEHEFDTQAIPDGSLDLTPSAELSAAQAVDEGKGDPLIYPYHDLLFTSWVEWWNRATPEDILTWYETSTLEEKLGYEGRINDLFDGPAAFIADLERWWDLYQGLAVAKRIQAPPILAVKRRAFGFDHREAQIGPYYTRRYERVKRRMLGSK